MPWSFMFTPRLEKKHHLYFNDANFQAMPAGPPVEAVVKSKTMVLIGSLA
jgi:hypothetical protein